MSIFPESLLLPPNENELEISTFGPGYGESIVLHIPQIGWGIIDSFITKIGGRQIIPPLEYLLNLFPNNHPPLAFVVLTHPDADHYRGLDQILNRYPGNIQRVCRYDGDGIRELKIYIAQQRKAYRNELPGLVEVFNALEAAKNSGTQFRRLGEMTSVFDFKNIHINGYGATNIRMLALSPSSASVQKYVQMLFKRIPEVGKPVLPLEDGAHNLISVALLLEIGDIQIILGGDVENGSHGGTGWKGIILNRDCPALWANLVKVAHHGSANGIDEETWKMHYSKAKPLAVITPFTHGNVQLPQQESIDKLKDITRKIGLTGSVGFSDKLYEYYPRDVLRGIKNQIRSMKIIKTQNKVGMIRVRFLLNGETIECLAESPAAWI